MAFNFNLLNKTCIKSIDQLTEFTRNVENMRINMSFLDFTNSNSNKDDSYWLRSTIKIAFYLIIITIALLGNLLIIIVICFNRFMRKSTNYFILNLAACDLAIVLSCMWVQIAMTINKFWILGEIFCKLNSFMQMVSIIASVLTLTVISCDRYFGIAHPLKARITGKRSYFFIFLIWLIAIVISIPSFYYRTYTERKWADFKETHCDDLGWPTDIDTNENGCALKIIRPVKRIYYTTVILFLFFLPIFIMSITYSIIIYKLRKKSEILGESYSEDKRTVLKKRKQVIVMLVWILAIFFVCWSPLETMLLFMEYTQEFPIWWSDLEWISYFMAYSNTAINPFIYAGLSENYKLGFKRVKDRIFKNSTHKYTIPMNKSLKINLKATTSNTNKSSFTNSIDLSRNLLSVK